MKLTWKPGGNKYHVVYVIEPSDADLANWTTVHSTTKTKVTLTNFPPGRAKWFRAHATKNDLSSTESFPASIYSPASALADAA